MFEGIKNIWAAINADPRLPISGDDLKKVMDETEATVNNLHKRLVDIEGGVKSDISPLTNDQNVMAEINNIKSYLSQLFPHIPLPELPKKIEPKAETPEPIIGNVITLDNINE